jgi:hypothetical protein
VAEDSREEPKLGMSVNQHRCVPLRMGRLNLTG